MKRWLKQPVAWALGGFLIGALIILTVRFVTYKPSDQVHYHANFAVFINGQQEQFKDAFYYEEEAASCSVVQIMTPHERAHLHDNVNSVIHVHDHAVTWEQFFNNIGWNVDTSFIKTPTQLYLADSANKVTFVLNGETTDNLINQVIGDKDRLLVDFGQTAPAALLTEYKHVPATAAEEDASKDPASCGGSAPVTTHDRLRHLF